MSRVPIKRHWRFKGICSDAAALGVDRAHLTKVLTGKRPSKSLTARYNALKTAQATRQTQPNVGPMALKQRTANVGPAKSTIPTS